MRFFSSLKSFFVKAATPTPAFIIQEQRMESWATESYAELAILAEQSSWIDTACRHVAQGCAQQGVHVLEKNGEGAAEIVSHPFELLMDKPNEEDSCYDLMERTVLHLLQNGNAYWYLNDLDPTDGVIEEIWSMFPEYMNYRKDDEQSDPYWEYTGWGSTMHYPYTDIVHFQLIDPRKRHNGMSALKSVVGAAKADIAAQLWNLAFFSDGNAKASGILNLNGSMEPSAFASFRAALEGKAGGAKNKRLLVTQIREGFQFVNTSVTQKDMEFNAVRQFYKEEIWAHIAPGLASIIDVNATEANAKAGVATFNERAIWPVLQKIGAKITQRILPRYGENLVCRFDDPRLKDRAAELAEAVVAKDFLTTTEIRMKYFGLPPLAQGEKPASAEFTSSPSPLMASNLPAFDEPMALKALSPMEATLEKAIMATLRSFFDEAVASIMSQGGSFDVASLEKALVDTAGPLLQQQIVDRFKQLGSAYNIEVDPDLAIARAADWWTQNAQWMSSVANTTKEAVDKVFVEFENTPGMTRADIEDKLTAIGFSKQRAQNVAITESTRAAAGAFNGYQEELAKQGVSMIRIWQTLADELTCQICGPLNQKDESEWAGDFPDGPPAHSRCRCSLSLEIQEGKKK